MTRTNKVSHRSEWTVGSFFAACAPSEAVLSTAPLSARERSAIQRILSISINDRLVLHDHHRAALDAYASVLSVPPLAPDDVARSARALIQVWARVPVGTRVRPILEADVANDRERPEVFRTTVTDQGLPFHRCSRPIDALSQGPARIDASASNDEWIVCTLLELQTTALTEPMSPLTVSG